MLERGWARPRRDSPRQQSTLVTDSAQRGRDATVYSTQQHRGVALLDRVRIAAADARRSVASSCRRTAPRGAARPPAAHEEHAPDAGCDGALDQSGCALHVHAPVDIQGARESAAPGPAGEAAAPVESRRDDTARLQQARQRGAVPVVGEVNEETVAARPRASAAMPWAAS